MNKKYPSFSDISIEHHNRITKHNEVFKPYSDFNFTSLFCWNIDNSAQIAELNGNLLIKLPDYLTGEPVISVLGINDIEDTIDAILKFTDKIGLVPHTVIQSITDRSKFEIVEDVNNFDYVYDVSKIANLSGGELKKKRNKVNKVIKDIGEHTEVSNTMTLTDNDKLEIMALFERWVEENQEPTENSAQERVALSRLLDHADSLNIITTQVRLHGRLIGFSINELLSNNYAICHFEKASLVHDNIYAFLATHSAKELTQHKVKLVNWEQDLGIEGIRKSKLSYQPVEYLKKYTITAR